MYINIKPIVFLFLFIALSEAVYPVNLRDLKSICKRTSNYQRCMKDFTNKKYNKKKERFTVIKGPIPIKIIPYNEK